MTKAGSPWHVYFLRCGDGSLYAGATSDLARRVAVHQRGRGAAYTRSRRPVELVYAEAASDRSSALRREAALKRLSRAAKLGLVAKPRAAIVGADVALPGTMSKSPGVRPRGKRPPHSSRKAPQSRGD